MVRKSCCWLFWLLAVGEACGVGGLSPIRAADPPRQPAAGRVSGCEHFAFVRAKVPEGLGGPARQAAKSWHVLMHVAPDGTAYVLDAENSQVYRVRGGTVRVLAVPLCSSQRRVTA